MARVERGQTFDLIVVTRGQLERQGKRKVGWRDGTKYYELDREGKVLYTPPGGSKWDDWQEE